MARRPTWPSRPQRRQQPGSGHPVLWHSRRSNVCGEQRQHPSHRILRELGHPDGLERVHRGAGLQSDLCRFIDHTDDCPDRVWHTVLAAGYLVECEFPRRVRQRVQRREGF